MPKFSLGRRRFTLAAAVAAAGTLVHPKEVLSEAPLLQQAPPAGALEKQAQAAMARLSSQAQAEVEMKVASIFRKYGHRLSDEQKMDIRRAMAETQDGLEKMRAFVLHNGDQPATVFHPYRNEGKK